MSFGQKVGLGVGAAAVSYIIAAGGYIGTAAPQTESAKFAIKFAFGYFGAILCAGMLVVCLFFNIDKHEKQIKEDLENKNS